MKAWHKHKRKHTHKHTRRTEMFVWKMYGRVKYPVYIYTSKGNTISKGNADKRT